jgi:hypothetical protein
MRTLIDGSFLCVGVKVVMSFLAVTFALHSALSQLPLDQTKRDKD